MEVFNKSVILKIIVSVLLINMVYTTYRIVSKPRKIELDEVKLKDEIKIDKSKTLAVMLQNDTGEYTESESNAFPTTGYRFNSTKSGCTDVNGNIIENALTYNNETNKVNLKINREVKCYTYFDKLYTVTFDTNGGEFSGSTPTKKVAYGDTYGEMPEEPTREGYTFKGWNGKNMAYASDVAISTKNGITYSVNDAVIKISGTNTNTSVNAYGLFQLPTINLPKLEIGKKYTFCTSADMHLYGRTYTAIDVYDNEKGTYSLTGVYTGKCITFMVPDTFNNVVVIRFGVYGDATTIDKSFTIQLEEGTVASEYEPYYIESDTKVVQRQNHTLKAIWEENS